MSRPRATRIRTGINHTLVRDDDKPLRLPFPMHLTHAQLDMAARCFGEAMTQGDATPQSILIYTRALDGVRDLRTLLCRRDWAVLQRLGYPKEFMDG